MTSPARSGAREGQAGSQSLLWLQDPGRICRGPGLLLGAHPKFKMRGVALGQPPPPPHTHSSWRSQETETRLGSQVLQPGDHKALPWVLASAAIGGYYFPANSQSGFLSKFGVCNSHPVERAVSARRDQLLGLHLGCLFPKVTFSFLTAQEMLTKGLGTWERQKENKKKVFHLCASKFGGNFGYLH